MRRSEIKAAITRQRVNATVRADPVEAASETGRALLEAGLVAVGASLTPPTGPETIRTSRIPDTSGRGARHDSAVLWGATEPTEILRTLDADVVKLSPTAAPGIDLLRARRGPLPPAPRVTTGGIEPRDVPA